MEKRPLAQIGFEEHPSLFFFIILIKSCCREFRFMTFSFFLLHGAYIRFFTISTIPNCGS
eukprot:snap_masked-scaffold_31-processed-gene-3.58-mRNA-1 protein AED:1.00 eAED:1.00 QI:0/0/0/0/1/1/3/0/59